MRNKVLVVALSTLVALGTWAGVDAATSAGAAQHSNTRTPTVSHVVHKQAHQTTVHTAKAKAKAKVKAQRKATAAQSGESATESGGGTESESATESESGTESDSHEDPAGQDVNHECPPDCDTANGEQP